MLTNPKVGDIVAVASIPKLLDNAEERAAFEGRVCEVERYDVDTGDVFVRFASPLPNYGGIDWHGRIFPCSDLDPVTITILDTRTDVEWT